MSSGGGSSYSQSTGSSTGGYTPGGQNTGRNSSGSTGQTQSTTNTTGQSSSTPENMYSAQTTLSLQIAEAAAALGNQTYDWAQSTLAPDAALTDANIADYQNYAGGMNGLSNNLVSDFNNYYTPEMVNSVNQAGAYGSTAKEQVNAGAAEANSAQGTQAASAAAKQAMQSYGINPNSGMYQNLIESNQVAGGAAAAAAGTTAAQSTQAAGRTLLAGNIATGLQLPGAATNATTAATAATSGAENAGLANTTTGATALDAANPYFSSAMTLKAPPVGTASQATNSTQSQSTGVNASSSTGTTTAPGTTPSQSQNQSTSSSVTNPSNSNSQPNNGSGTYGGGGGGGGGGGYAAGGTVGMGIPAFVGGGGTGMDPTTGGYTPASASPSGGQATDDVDAKLTAGEFVIPRDVTAWEGQKSFQTLIAKARKAMGSQAQAQPTMGPRKPSGPPTFQSKPIQRAARGGPIRKFAGGGYASSNATGGTNAVTGGFAGAANPGATNYTPSGTNQAGSPPQTANPGAAGYASSGYRTGGITPSGTNGAPNYTPSGNQAGPAPQTGYGGYMEPRSTSAIQATDALAKQYPVQPGMYTVSGTGYSQWASRGGPIRGRAQGIRA